MSDMQNEDHRRSASADKNVIPLCLLGLEDCQECTARKEARIPILPVGPLRKHWVMVVGRNPGKEEDAGGEPFIGRSGKFLNGYLERIGLRREEVYITNTVKCHTKNDRPPDPIEIKTCSTLWLHKEGKELKPRLILVLGQDAYKGIFGHRVTPWIEHTGKIIQFADYSHVAVLPHPAGALRNKMWRKRYEVVEESLKLLVKRMKDEVPISY